MHIKCRYSVKCWLVIGLLISLSAHAQRELPLAFLTFDGLFASPTGEIFAAAGFAGSEIYIVLPDGNTSVYADGLSGPIDIAGDGEGNLFVTNFNDATVSQVSTDGTVSHFADVLPFPSGIVRDSQGNLYVTHFGNSDPATGFGLGDSVVKVFPDGSTELFSEGGLLAAPVGITVDEHDNIYTANLHDGTVLMLDQQGSQTLIADLTGPEISFAIGHLEYVNNRLFATGIQNQALFRINPNNGRVRTRDISNRVSFPNGITFSPQASALFVTDAFLNNAALARFNQRVDDRVDD